MASAVSFQAKSANAKLSPQDGTPYIHPRTGRHFERPIPKPPYACSTSVSIASTCPSTCRYKDNGCYEQAGLTGGRARARDRAAASMTGDSVAELEAATIDAQWPQGVPQDGARGGRDLRLHVAGDAPSEHGARLLAAAARRWLERGGGVVWTYTARWGEIPRRAWDPIIVLASVQTIEEADEAAALGYTPAYSIAQFESKRVYPMRHSKTGLRVLPCPAETSGRDCVQCRMCLRKLPGDMAIGFEVHGNQRRKHQRLPILGERVEDEVDNIQVLHARAFARLVKTRDSIEEARIAVQKALAAAGIAEEDIE